MIVEDYALSGEAMRNLLDWLKEEYSETADEVERYAPAVMSAHPEAMAEFLARLREDYGSFDDLARTLRIEREVQRLRQSLLEVLEVP